MSSRRSYLAALVLQTLLPFSSGAFFENNADALRELEIPVARSLHALKPFGKRQSDGVVGKTTISPESSKMKR